MPGVEQLRQRLEAAQERQRQQEIQEDFGLARLRAQLESREKTIKAARQASRQQIQSQFKLAGKKLDERAKAEEQARQAREKGEPAPPLPALNAGQIPVPTSPEGVNPAASGLDTLVQRGGVGGGPQPSGGGVAGTAPAAGLQGSLRPTAQELQRAGVEPGSLAAEMTRVQTATQPQEINTLGRFAKAAVYRRFGLPAPTEVVRQVAVPTPFEVRQAQTQIRRDQAETANRLVRLNADIRSEYPDAQLATGIVNAALNGDVPAMNRLMARQKPLSVRSREIDLQIKEAQHTVLRNEARIKMVQAAQTEHEWKLRMNWEAMGLRYLGSPADAVGQFVTHLSNIDNIQDPSLRIAALKSLGPLSVSMTAVANDPLTGTVPLINVDKGFLGGIKAADIEPATLGTLVGLARMARVGRPEDAARAGEALRRRFNVPLTQDGRINFMKLHEDQPWNVETWTMVNHIADLEQMSTAHFGQTALNQMSVDQLLAIPLDEAGQQLMEGIQIAERSSEPGETHLRDLAASMQLPVTPENNALRRRLAGQAILSLVDVKENPLVPTPLSMARKAGVETRAAIEKFLPPAQPTAIQRGEQSLAAGAGPAQGEAVGQPTDLGLGTAGRTVSEGFQFLAEQFRAAQERARSRRRR